jgi:ABC-type sugar transport system permease subunit
MQGGTMKKFTLTKDEKKAYIYLLPGFIVTALLIIYPLYYIITMSFSNNGINQSGFAGFDNYLKLFKNPQFSKAIINTAKFTGFSVVGAYILGFILALAINRKSVKLKGMWRGLIFISWIIPGVVKATSWKWLYRTDGGMFNHILQTIGLTSEELPWLTSPKYAMWAIIIVQIWATAPYVMLLMTAGLQQISKELYESADLDGANFLHKLKYITIPLTRDITFICALMLLVWAINEFSLIWIMTTGGQNTTTLSLLVYNQFKMLNINSASASAVMQLIITMAFAALYVKLSVKED